MKDRNYEVQIYNGHSDHKLPEYYKDGRIFIEARIESEYRIKVKNNGFKRALVITSVDGLDVLSGKKANEHSSGYVLEPFNSLEIKGFRENSDSVGAFKFVGKYASYAKSQGKGGNEGVIGVRIFEEKEVPVITYSTNIPAINSQNWISNVSYSDNNFNDGHILTCSCDSALLSRTSVGGYGAKSFDAGTTWGQRIEDRVTTTTFEKGNLAGYFDIYYATKSVLESLGISFKREKQVAFPQSFEGKFARPPSGWCG